MTEPNAAEWLSAWSTFWAAIAAAVGAIGTVGALWVGALTLRRQVNDQHRQQASAVTVGSQPFKRPMHEDRYRCFIMNNSSSPIYNVVLNAQLADQHFRDHTEVLEPKGVLQIIVDKTENRRVIARFTDSAGNFWLRDNEGNLMSSEKTSRLRERWNQIQVWSAKKMPNWLRGRP
ncbi:hypothetical protein SAMN04487914_108124 [Arthrobacter sp. ok909]|uniref:hypothetical protein n=1 Tax=Arthrobacter sp. ok909 TaxID=1761746 RepID=UPI00088A953A|nr:hypothetical protein [Arthrobacter sp. ok909]SDP33882.1 hypothetical protein SAMN04487914_108124 [Arthrobacter sp. ok909]